MNRSQARGFTLIEVMVTVAIVAILAGVALPSYSAYMRRSKVPVALDNLSALYTRMEQRYQDTGNYANGSACGIAMPTVANFTLTCSLGSGATANQSYTATATGSGPMSGYTYTINNVGARVTTAHPKGANANCWTTRGGTQCDT